MIIRNAKLSDAGALSRLAAATFTDKFGHLYSATDLTNFLKQHHSETYYAAAIADSSTPIWVASRDHDLMGYAMVGPNHLPCDSPLPEALELRRIYISQAFQGRGIGDQFMQIILNYARQQKYHDVILGVFSLNFGAQKFYERLGFRKVGEYDFYVGQHRDREWIMHLPLDDVKTGTISPT